MTGLVKVCGLSTPETLDAAIGAGADMVGFVHYSRSPRHVGLEQGAMLSAGAKGRVLRVALVVDAEDDVLAAVVEALDPDVLQLHGSETSRRVAAIRARFKRPVMKAVGIARAEDLAAAATYRSVVDRVLLDAKPPRASALPGGNGVSFDWGLVAGLDLGAFMLSGGLTPLNVADGIALTGARAVDVSSGVETAPGRKCPERIAAFIRAARKAFARSSTGLAPSGA